MIKHLRNIVIAALFVGVLSFNGIAEAQASPSLYYQTTKTSDTGFIAVGNSGNFIAQRLGNGLSGVATEISFQNEAMAATAIDFAIYSCASLACNPFATGVVESNAATTSVASSSQKFVSLDTQVSFDPSRYYMIVFFNVDGQPNQKFYGSAADLYTGGYCDRYTAGAWVGSCTGINDLFFIVNGVQTVSDTSYTWLMQPANASTTSSTLVSASFRYHAAAANSITSYAMLFHDYTQDSDFTITGSASTGDATVSRVLTLTSGHGYTYTAYVCNDDATCFGGPTVSFTVVTPTFGIGVTNTNGTSTVGSTTILTPTGVGSVLPTIDVITESNASSSVEQIGSSFLNIPAFIANKFPFSWMYEIGEILKDGASASTTVPTWTIDFTNASTTAWSHGIMAAIGPITILSEDVVEMFLTYDQWQDLRIIFSYLMWASFGFWFLYKILGVTI